MAQLSDFISRIFSTDRTQGLSGGAEVVIDRDPASAFYASRLRKHRTDEDLVEAPANLWSTVSYHARRGGLRAHIQAERGDGVASFTDALVVLNAADASRVAQRGREPWIERAVSSIRDKFTGYCEKERFELLYGLRPLHVRFVDDGGPEMLGQSFGLAPGEFLTGLLPNLYVGPVPRSRPVLAVHVNLPGVWEGYREVGKLYSDQILFTLGRHWLDNFSHPSLLEPGLYRLQQYPDGSLVHVISPELQDRYLVRSDSLDTGASVLTVAERGGRAIAYLVLAVVDQQASMDGASMAFEVRRDGRGEPQISPALDRSQDPPTERPTTPARPSPTPTITRDRRDPLQRTIVPDALNTRMLTLQERGALLQKVHFVTFMEGYDVYVGPGGRVATQMAAPHATFQVRGNRVSLVVQDPTVKVDGRAMAAGARVALAGAVDIEVDGHVLQYRDLTGVDVEGWPYLAEIRRPGAGTYLEFGDAFRVGRDRRCKVRLPDEPHNDNIAWLSSVGGGTTIRSRTGDIPKSRFYTDSIMVASEHAEIDLRSEPILRSLARHCFTYVRSGNVIVPLSPRESATGGRTEVELSPGDEVLVGNCLFQVSYPPPGSASANPAYDIPAISPSLLAPTPAAPPAPATPVAETPRTRRAAQAITIDPAAAFGLGERGPAPRSPVVTADRLALSKSARTGDTAPPGSEGTPSPSPAPTPVPGVAAANSTPTGGSRTGPVATPPRSPTSPVSTPARPADAPADAPRAASLSLAGGAVATPIEPVRPVTPPPGPPPPPMLLEDPATWTATDGAASDPPSEPLFAEVEPESPDPVVSVVEAQWKVEMARPGRLRLVGWMVSGEIVVGNHRGSTVIVPEVRAFPEQAFLTLDYFRLNIRGKKTTATLLQEGEATIRLRGDPVAATDDLDGAVFEIIRRDANLEPDFDVTLRVVRDEALPDPRARLLSVDTTDRLVAALFTTGFPMRSDRRLRLGAIEPLFRFDGATLRISDYLRTYRATGVGQGTGFRPFFLREGTGPWQTFPEDGERVELQPGDGLIAGNTVYRFET